jgi:hypothetical protein
MEQEKLREVWAELCFHLSDNINPSINEHVFEQKVLLTFEKLGWSQFKGELKVKPSLQIGRQGYITPDIVVYTPENKAVLVLEIKRPAEDLSKPGCIGQLQSYMRQTKADFGLLVGKEIYVYYEGALSRHADPLLLSKIRFKSDSAEGIDFVRLFNRNSFIAGGYESYLKEHIERLARERKIDAMRERLQSEETRQKLLKLLQNEYCGDVETQILMESMKGLTIEISYQQSFEKKKNGHQESSVSEKSQQSLSVCKNKASGKYFIHIEDLKDGAEFLLMTPEGSLVARCADLFNQPKDEKTDYLLSYKLITEMQLEKYNEYESQQSEDIVTSNINNPYRSKPKRIQPTGGAKGTKSPSPSAYDWCRRVPELSIFSDRVKWREICDYLNIEVGGNRKSVV